MEVTIGQQVPDIPKWSENDSLVVFHQPIWNLYSQIGSSPQFFGAENNICFQTTTYPPGN